MACKNFILDSCNIIHLVIVFIVLITNCNGYNIDLNSLSLYMWQLEFGINLLCNVVLGSLIAHLYLSH